MHLWHNVSYYIYTDNEGTTYNRFKDILYINTKHLVNNVGSIKFITKLVHSFNKKRKFLLQLVILELNLKILKACPENVSLNTLNRIVGRFSKHYPKCYRSWAKSFTWTLIGRSLPLPSVSCNWRAVYLLKLLSYYIL